MANIASAKKRARQNILRRIHNHSLRSKARTYIKKLLALIKKKDYDNSMQEFKQTSSVLDKMINKGIYKKNTVARIKSKLNNKIKNLKAIEV